MGTAIKFSLIFKAHVTLVILLIISKKVASAQIECGTIDEVLAQHDLRAQIPWAAVLYFQSTKCDFRPAGNGHGVIIGPNTVLMRGNFMWSFDGFGGVRMDSYSPHYFMIAVGLKSKLPFVADQHTQFLKVESIQPHYLSYDAYSEFDYAIVRLRNPIQFTSFVRPLCVDVLPDVIFDRKNHSLLNSQLKISGFRTGSGNYRSALHVDEDSFGLLSPEVCSSKLETELFKASASSPLLKAGTPCGVSVKSMEDLLDFRLFTGTTGRDEVSTNPNTLAYIKQYLNFTNSDTTKGLRPLSNICFHNGASVMTLYKGKWHLVGIVTESLGMSCEKNLYFVSFVASKNNLNWILQHLRNSPSSFICSNGQSVHMNMTCNADEDCLDGSDEDAKMCECGLRCGTSHCLLQPMCKHCEPSDSLKVLSRTYSFSKAQTAIQSNCPPVTPPKDASVYCKAPGLKSRIPCEHQHFPGTQAIFSCKHFTSSSPSTYCVITCQENGKWTDELDSFKCKPNETQGQGQEEDLDNFNVSERRNFSSSSAATGSLLQTTEMAMKITGNNENGGEGKEASISFHTSYKDKNGTLMCPPVEVSNGTEVSCWTGSSSKKISCFRPMYPGSKVEFTCKPYYKPLLSTSSVIKHCQPDGEWSLNNRNFECRLDCGIPKKEIIGHVVNGRETDGTKWPWHGLIFIDVGGHNYTYICGSTLISRRILVSAAHCVTQGRKSREVTLYKVVMAAISNVYVKNILDEEIQIFDVTSIVVQPHFNLANFEADIAILQLSRPVQISDFVRPACYPSTLGGQTELKHLSPGSLGTVVGFGYDETGQPSKTLKEASLPVVSYRDCDEVAKIQHSATQFCAGYTNGTAVCNGDSGSGMFFEEYAPQKRYYLQGIVSHGNRDHNSRMCDHNQYSVFTKVASFKNWISETGYELDEDF